VGGPQPPTWIYLVTLGGLNATLAYDGLPAASVIHLRYAVDPIVPWRGMAPLQAAVLVVEAGDWVVAADWQAKRLGANPPAAMVDLAAHASNAVYAVSGMNPAVFAAAQGTRAGKPTHRCSTR